MDERLQHGRELSFSDLIADPIVRMIMKADGIGEGDLRELLGLAAARQPRSRDKAVSPQPETQPAARTPMRRGVGIMLLNSREEVFVGQRIDTEAEAWQMPQGGIDHGETPRAAALRELREELGTANAEVIAASRSWLSYEIPGEILARIPSPRCRGQTQQWFLMRFRGADRDIDIATEHPEFSAWKWVPVESLLDLVVPFKRDVYRSVIREFEPHLRESSRMRR